MQLSVKQPSFVHILQVNARLSNLPFMLRFPSRCLILKRFTVSLHMSLYVTTLRGPGNSTALLLRILVSQCFYIEQKLNYNLLIKAVYIAINNCQRTKLPAVSTKVGNFAASGQTLPPEVICVKTNKVCVRSYKLTLGTVIVVIRPKTHTTWYMTQHDSRLKLDLGLEAEIINDQCGLLDAGLEKNLTE